MASIRGGFFPALSSVAHSDAWKWQAVEDRGRQLGAAAIRASLETYERAISILNAIALAGHEAAMHCALQTGSKRKLKAMDVMTDADFAKAAELYQSICRSARGTDNPVIVAINGFALGGGLEVVLMADIRARPATRGPPSELLRWAGQVCIPNVRNQGISMRHSWIRASFDSSIS
jgi:enoyl-CoA hydratase/isomerase-like protein